MGKKQKAMTVAKAPAAVMRRRNAWPHALYLASSLAAIIAAGVLMFQVQKGAPSAPAIEMQDKATMVGQSQDGRGEARKDNHTNCAAWAAANECKSNPSFMLDQCSATCAKVQKSELPEGGLPDGWHEHMDASSGRVFYSDGVTSRWERPSTSSKVQAKPSRASQATSTSDVQDTWHTQSDCSAWAGSGQCEANPGFMLVSCEQSCHKLGVTRSQYAERCKRPAGAKPALTPGSMVATFERIMAEFANLEPELISEDPPLVLFHRFLSDAEADVFVQHGQGKYAESKGVGVDSKGRMTDVKTEIRTSSHTWCQEAACLTDPAVQRVIARVSDVTQTPEANGEFAQLVYYRSCPADGHPSCAFYRRHSDFIGGDEHRNQGVRIYTLFMYLNDVPEGGGTRFTDLPQGPVTFQPQRGKAILWPSVLADAPNTIDPRTHHEALPVTKGEKYGANFWIHQYDFKSPHKVGCTMD